MTDVRKDVEGLISRMQILRQVKDPSPEMIELIDYCNSRLGELLKDLPEFNDFDAYTYGPDVNGDTEDDI